MKGKSSTPEEVKKRKKAVLFCLSEDKKNIILEEGKEILVGDVGQTVDDPYATFVKMLPDKDCRYALYDATYETKESKKEDLGVHLLVSCSLWWALCPFTCSSSAPPPSRTGRSAPVNPDTCVSRGGCCNKRLVNEELDESVNAWAQLRGSGSYLLLEGTCWFGATP